MLRELIEKYASIENDVIGFFQERQAKKELGTQLTEIDQQIEAQNISREEGQKRKHFYEDAWSKGMPQI